MSSTRRNKEKIFFVEEQQKKDMKHGFSDSLSI